MNAEKSELLFKPTLAIGLGGLGSDCIRRARQAYLSKFDGIPYAQFLEIDTDGANMPGDALLLTRYNPQQMLQELESQDSAALRERLQGIDLTKAKQFEHRLQTVIHIGTYGQRLYGLFGFYSYFGRIKRHLERAIGEIVKKDEGGGITEPTFSIGDRNARLAQLPEGGTPFNVFIISSLAGGTGGGCFLDLAYLCRYLLREHTSLISGVFLLPNVIAQRSNLTSVEFQRQQANTYAALKELDHLKNNPKWKFTYPGNLTISENAPPYDFCYLIGAKDETGRIYEQQGSSLERVAQGVLAFIDPEIAQHINAFQTNVSVLGEEYPRYLKEFDRTAHADQIRRRWYGSFNASLFDARQELDPVGGFQTYATSRLATEAIKFYLNRREWTDDEILRRNQAFLKEYDLNRVIRDLTENMRISRIDEARRRIATPEATAKLKKQLSEDLGRHINSLLQELGQEAAEKAINLLTAFRTQTGSLTGLETQITDYVNQSVQRSEGEYNKARGRVGQLKYITNIAEFLSWLWDQTRDARVHMEANRKILASAEQALLTKQIESVAARVFTGVLLDVAQEIQGRLAEYNRHRVLLGLTQQLFEQDITRARPEAGSLYLKTYPEKLQEEMALLLSTEVQKMLEKGQLSSQSLQAHLAREAETILGRVKVDWIDFLTASAFFEDERLQIVAKALQRVESLNVPLWSFNQQRLSADETESLALIGVPNPNDQRIPDRIRKGDTKLVAMGEENTSQVFALHIRHGVPLSLLYGPDEWQAAYKRIVSEEPILPLHVIAGELPDLIPNSY